MFIFKMKHPNRDCRSYIFPYRLAVQSSWWRPGSAASVVRPLSTDPFGANVKLVRMLEALQRSDIERIDIGDPIDTIYIKVSDGHGALGKWHRVEANLSKSFCLEIKQYM